MIFFKCGAFIQIRDKYKFINSKDIGIWFSFYYKLRMQHSKKTTHITQSKSKLNNIKFNYFASNKQN